MNPSKTDGPPCAERERSVAGGVRVLFGPVIARGDVLRWRGDACGSWVERWDGSAWLKGGSVSTLVAGRRLTDGELVRMLKPSGPLQPCFCGGTRPPAHLATCPHRAQTEER
jgi:hypothetical protein